MMTALPPPRSRPAAAALRLIALESLSTSSRASASEAYGLKRVPPKAGPRAVEWMAMMVLRPGYLVVTEEDLFMALEGNLVEYHERPPPSQGPGGVPAGRSYPLTQIRGPCPLCRVLCHDGAVIKTAFRRVYSSEAVTVDDPIPASFAATRCFLRAEAEAIGWWNGTGGPLHVPCTCGCGYSSRLSHSPMPCGYGCWADTRGGGAGRRPRVAGVSEDHP